MRPLGEISLALLRAAEELAHEVDGKRHGPTLRELARRACVGMKAARCAVQNLHRAERLEPVASRRVSYRNRPVLEYAPTRVSSQAETVDVAAVFAVWAQE